MTTSDDLIYCDKASAHYFSMLFRPLPSSFCLFHTVHIFNVASRLVNYSKKELAISGVVVSRHFPH